MIIIDKHSKDIQSSNNYIALGSFDGLHIGHLSLINKVVEVAKKIKGEVWFLHLKTIQELL
ncbi:FAD synthase [Clostridium beijerinckii]|nr:FAD synthase [Clostridium beijerinckii]NSA00928.1 FAD synthase [Clostridium beijerinckii]